MYDASTRGNETEDEVVFVQPDGAQKILRGTIINETKYSVIVQRRDGDHEIMRSTIRKIVRRSIESAGAHKRYQKEEERRDLIALFDKATQGGAKVADLAKLLGIDKEGER